MSEPAALDMPATMSAESHVTDVVHQARTSFYWAMRLLPRAKRQAMFAVYAFCRVVDDIADGDLPAGTKLSQLQGWRDEIGRLYAGDPRHPVARALQAPVAGQPCGRRRAAMRGTGRTPDGSMIKGNLARTGQAGVRPS